MSGSYFSAKGPFGSGSAAGMEIDFVGENDWCLMVAYAHRYVVDSKFANAWNLFDYGFNGGVQFIEVAEIVWEIVFVKSAGIVKSGIFQSV